MISTSLLLASAALVVLLFRLYARFTQNIHAAKQSGIPYIVAPLHTFNRFWLLVSPLLLPLLRRLPAPWIDPWLDTLDAECVWIHRYKLFEKLGSDVFLIASAGKTSMFVADPEVAYQITSRRNDFPKPVEIYKAVNIYGSNVVSAEGSVWRQHRKITSLPFTEKNNLLVWKESLHQGRAILQHWLDGASNQSRTVNTVASDTMRLSLALISRAGFGVRLLWPHEEMNGNVDGSIATASSANVPPGHTMSYTNALATLLENLIAVMLLPSWLLGIMPFKALRAANQAFLEWGKYMNELYVKKKADVRAGRKTDNDLMAALVKGTGLNAEFSAANGGREKDAPADKHIFADEEILGNTFVFMLAGHETVASTIHFSLLFLALNPTAQTRLQQDLDDIFGDRPISEWDYDHDLPRLFGGMAGAIMNEELRLMPPVVNIPKCTRKGSPQTLQLNGRKVTVPENTSIYIAAVALHRNPHLHWPSATGATDRPATDLDDFRPERWLLGRKAQPDAPSDGASDDHEKEFGAPAGKDFSSALYRPPRGAYVPFSDGPRACLGRRFAQVETLAVLAVLFRSHSVELAVDEFASDVAVEAMPVGGEERRAVWRRAKERCEHLMHYGMSSLITNQMRRGRVPVRFVRRGCERFVFE